MTQSRRINPNENKHFLFPQANRMENALQQQAFRLRSFHSSLFSNFLDETDVARKKDDQNQNDSTTQWKHMITGNLSTASRDSFIGKVSRKHYAQKWQNLCTRRLWWTQALLAADCAKRNCAIRFRWFRWFFSVIRLCLLEKVRRGGRRGGLTEGGRRHANASIFDRFALIAK